MEAGDSPDFREDPSFYFRGCRPLVLAGKMSGSIRQSVF